LLNNILFKPGPAKVHPEVLKAAVLSFQYHRSSEFKEFHCKLIPKLKQFFLTYSIFRLLYISGTEAVEDPAFSTCYSRDGSLKLACCSISAKLGILACINLWISGIIGITCYPTMFQMGEMIEEGVKDFIEINFHN
jgi:hypothetical protein